MHRSNEERETGNTTEHEYAFCASFSFMSRVHLLLYSSGYDAGNYLIIVLFIVAIYSFNFHHKILLVMLDSLWTLET